MCGACKCIIYIYIYILPFKKPLISKRNSYEKIKVLGAMCKVIGILKIIPQHKNGCLQRGANGKNVNHVLMK
jgi:hypothetical protein